MKAWEGFGQRPKLFAGSLVDGWAGSLARERGCGLAVPRSEQLKFHACCHSALAGAGLAAAGGSTGKFRPSPARRPVSPPPAALPPLCQQVSQGQALVFSQRDHETSHTWPQGARKLQGWGARKENGKGGLERGGGGGQRRLQAFVRLPELALFCTVKNGVVVQSLIMHSREPR